LPPLVRKFTPTPSPKIRWAVFLVLALVALAVRLPQLAHRPMHTDEAVNAYITGQLLAGKNFHYDPRDRHGPVLYLVAEPLVRLLGAKKFSQLTEIQLRLTPVLVGSATVLMFAAAVDMFGFIACVVAALLFAFAPLPLYYNRYFIHETLFVAATLGLILCLGRNRRPLVAAAFAGLCAALMLACKETAVIHFFAMGTALIVCRFFAGTPASRTAEVDNFQKFAGRQRVLPIAKMILTAGIVFVFTIVLLFTWFGQNWAGLTDLIRAIPSFAARAGGEGHEKPFWYYTLLLGGGWSGAVVLVPAAAGSVAAVLDFARQKFFSVFILVYGIVVFVIYSAIPYKTPWLALNFWLPLALLAGFAADWLWRRTKSSPLRWLFWLFAAVIATLLAHDVWQRVFLKPADEKNPYAYAHTSEDLLRLPARLNELDRQNKLSNPLIAVIAADAWPLPWYLRKFSQVGYWQPGQDPGAANYFITTTDVSDLLAKRLKNFRPEFFGVRPEVLLILWTPEATNAVKAATSIQKP
jgi:uncharacterized protein (TIGR03663 family)